MEKNTGLAYELFVQALQQMLLRHADDEALSNVQVQHNVTLEDKLGIKRQFDVLWAYEKHGEKIINVIECKDYASPVSIEKVDALAGKLLDFENVRGMIATSNGFQSGAKTKAQGRGIQLLLVRAEKREADWKDKDGNYRLRDIVLTLSIVHPWRFKSIRKILFADWWLKQHEGERISINQSLSDVMIRDLKSGAIVSVESLINEHDKEGEVPVKREIVCDYDDALLLAGGNEIGVAHVEIEYFSSYVTTREIKISPEVKGVVEDAVHGGKKILLNLDGEEHIIDAK